jgi:hypothetical protein
LFSSKSPFEIRISPGDYIGKKQGMVYREIGSITYFSTPHFPCSWQLGWELILFQFVSAGKLCKSVSFVRLSDEGLAAERLPAVLFGG